MLKKEAKIFGYFFISHDRQMSRKKGVKNDDDAQENEGMFYKIHDVGLENRWILCV